MQQQWTRQTINYLGHEYLIVQPPTGAAPQAPSDVVVRIGSRDLRLYPIALPPRGKRFAAAVYEILVVEGRTLTSSQLREALAAMGVTPRDLNPRSRAKAIEDEALREGIKQIMVCHLHMPICSSSKGFWCARTGDEIRTCVASVERRALRTYEGGIGVDLPDWHAETPDQRRDRLARLGDGRVELCRALLRILHHNGRTTGAQIAAKLTDAEWTTASWTLRGQGGPIRVELIREIVAAMRKEGVPVVASEKGYLLAQTHAEGIAQRASLTSRALGMRINAKHLEVSRVIWFPASANEATTAASWRSYRKIDLFTTAPGENPVAAAA